MCSSAAVQQCSSAAVQQCGAASTDAHRCDATKKNGVFVCRTRSLSPPVVLQHIRLHATPRHATPTHAVSTAACVACPLTIVSLFLMLLLLWSLLLLARRRRPPLRQQASRRSVGALSSGSSRSTRESERLARLTGEADPTKPKKTFLKRCVVTSCSLLPAPRCTNVTLSRLSFLPSFLSATWVLQGRSKGPTSKPWTKTQRKRWSDWWAPR